MFDEMTFAQIKTEFLLMEKQIADLKAQLDEANRRLEAAGVVPLAPAEPPLKIYPDVASIEWERYPDEASTYRKFPQLAYRMQSGFYNKKWLENGWHLPFRNVIVEGLGEVTRIGGKSSPDMDLIVRRRCLDVTSSELCALVQPGDDGYETDEQDIVAFLQSYKGGLRQPLSTWMRHDDYAPYAKVLAEARPDLVGNWEWERLQMTPAG